MEMFMKWLVEVFCGVVRWTGLAWLVRKLLSRGGVAILMYHNPRPEVLQQHLAYLSRHFRFISLDQLVEAIHAYDFSGIPRNSVVVTLDDGHSGNADLESIFSHFGVKPTVYLCSQIVGTRRRFWFTVPRLHGRSVKPIKALPTEERFERLQQEFGFDPTKEYPDTPPQALTREQVVRMADTVDLGAHTRFHELLTTCGDEESWQTVVGSKQEVETSFGRECRHFSYPNGDFLPRDVDFVRQAGFRSARTIDLGWNSLDTDPYRLKIVGVDDRDSLNRLVAQMSCVLSYFVRLLLRKGDWRGRHRVLRLVKRPEISLKSDREIPENKKGI
jgi:peptidoglycan/xylan/chitin deacetylase (PgdA/CDA1 family)